MLKYNFAYDESGKIVNIQDVPSEGHLDRMFTCIGCGGQMVAAIGSKRIYFRHKNDETNCNKESYLHKLAKLQIKQKFYDKTKPFEISFWGKKECKEHCKMFTEMNCIEDGTYPFFDLRKYYDTCKEEKAVDGYIADLLLTHSQYPNRPPVLIEIYVTHKCTNEKINSGNKIIEVTIDSEESIEKLVNSSWIQRPIYSIEDDGDKTTNVVLFGFNPQVYRTAISEYNGINHERFVLYTSGKYISITQKCFHSKQRYNRSSVMEINVPSRSGFAFTLEIAHYLKRVHKIELKACSICRYFYQDKYYARYCGRLPNKSMPLTGSEFFALECPHFALNWLNTLYRHLPENERLRDEDVEIVVPYNR